MYAVSAFMVEACCDESYTCSLPASVICIAHIEHRNDDRRIFCIVLNTSFKPPISNINPGFIRSFKELESRCSSDLCFCFYNFHNALIMLNRSRRTSIANTRLLRASALSQPINAFHEKIEVVGVDPFFFV